MPLHQVSGIKHLVSGIKNTKYKILNTKYCKAKGFTLIELLLIIGLFSILSTFIFINLLKPQTKASVDSTITTLVSDIKQQQVKTMAGDAEGQTSPFSFGLYFQSNRYVLFRGAFYQQSNSSNFTVELPDNILLTNIVFPQSQIVFARRSGEIDGYTEGSNVVTARNVQGGEQKTITINRYGAVTVN